MTWKTIPGTAYICRLAGLALCVAVMPALGQQPAPPAAKQDLGPPTERGLRFTPGMARGIAELMTREAFVRQFQLDEAKVPEVSEAIARRLMVAVNSNEEAATSFIEYMLVQTMEAGARQKEGGEGFKLSGETGQGFAQRVLPLVPAIKGILRDVTQDVRPHLPFKQQLTLTAQMAAASTAVDSLEKNLQRWARGEAKEGEDPFRPEQSKEKDAAGQSKAAQSARTAAEKETNKEASIRSIWEGYLKQFKEFYALDAAQSATADSILREYMERTRPTLQDPAWRDAIYRARLWLSMASGLRINWGTPVMTMLNKRYEQLMAPVGDLGDQFRHRLDEIPTEAQRTAADARMTEVLAKHGYHPTTSTAEAK
jgi:hypothetical protein